MTTAGDLWAKAKQLYEQAARTADATERLGYILQAIEMEGKAEVLERAKSKDTE